MRMRRTGEIKRLLDRVNRIKKEIKKTKMITYSIKEQAADPKEIKIVKTGAEVEFTIANIDADIIYLNKAKKELEGKLGVEKATMENVKGTHPHIAEMTPEDLTAAFLYRQAQGFVNIANEKLAEIEKQLTEYASDMKEILKQTGIVLPVEEVKTEETK